MGKNGIFDIRRRLLGRYVLDELELRKFSEIVMSLATVDDLGMCLYTSPSGEYYIHIGVGSSVVCSTISGNAKASVRGTDDRQFHAFFMHYLALDGAAKAYISIVLKPKKTSNKMKQKLYLLLLTLACLSIESKAETLLYEHSDLHLCFTIDTDTKTAILGNAFSSQDHNAIWLPPMDDPWWNENPSTNYWKDLDIPSTIICEGSGYTYDSDIKSIEKDTYTVVAINSKAFYKSTYVQTITLPETITSIGAYAFAWAIYLRSINLPSQLSAIGEGTFYYCKKLESIQLPATIQTIGSSSFSDCILLEEIRIPGNCTSIGDDAFTGCSAIHKIIIEDGTE